MEKKCPECGKVFDLEKIEIDQKYQAAGYPDLYDEYENAEARADSPDEIRTIRYYRFEGECECGHEHDGDVFFRFADEEGDEEEEGWDDDDEDDE